MGKLKNKLIDEQDAKIIEAEKHQDVICRDPETIRWLESVNRAESNYQANRGNTGVRWSGD
jgi:hypothetical protein